VIYFAVGFVALLVKSVHFASDIAILVYIFQFIFAGIAISLISRFATVAFDFRDVSAAISPSECGFSAVGSISPTRLVGAFLLVVVFDLEVILMVLAFTFSGISVVVFALLLGFCILELIISG
jgi:NADH:ubiquinone oxidoreductase subunit 3 (subunit A)